MGQQLEQISRREAIKKIGVVAGTTALGLSALKAIAAHTTDDTRPSLKVLLLNGSPRQDGNTFILLREAASQLEKNGIESEIFQLGMGDIHGCADCGGCHRTGKCIFDDAVNQIATKMRSCDAIIVGSPVYYGMPAGQVLAALQRLAYSAGGVLQGKPAAAVTVCRRGGATAAFQALQMAFQMLNMPIVTSQYWNIAYGAAKGEVSRDEEGMQTMRVLADNMSYMLRQFATGTAMPPKREGKRNTNFIR